YLRHGAEVPLGVERQAVVDGRVDGMRREREEQRMAIRSGLGGDRGADRATGTATVLDQDRLAELPGERLLHDARNDVGAAARRIRHDQVNGLRRPDGPGGCARPDGATENDYGKKSVHARIVRVWFAHQLRN